MTVHIVEEVIERTLEGSHADIPAPLRAPAGAPNLVVVLAFGLGQGVLGIWAGLCAGLIVVASVLLPVWARRSRRFAPAHPRPA